MVADLATGPASTSSSCPVHSDSEIGDWDFANYGLALETSGRFLGAMPPEKFLDKFLPVSQDAPKCPNPRRDFASVASAEKEDDMYAPFIAAAKPFAPNLMFIDTHANPDTQRNKLAPHISIYPIKDQPRGDAKTDFSKMDLFVEFKFTDTSDPFCDPEAPEAGDFRFEKDSKNARLFRGRLASYAAALAWCQFRVHSFCVLACGKYARFIRWDRSGATVTQRFNYIEDPHLIAGFFWSYDHLDRRQRGYDTSMIQEDIQRTLHLKPLQDDNPDHREFRKLMVPDRDEPKVEKQFVVSFPPRYKACSPFGRATRPMLAFDVEKGEIVFLKDYWREDGVKEGEIYALLESKRVPNIPPFGKGNDVRDDETLTDKLRNEEWACGSKDMVTLRHYRMTLDVVAEPLTSFRSSKELVSAIADAMEAHQHAYFDAHVLHRDISAGNILITDKVKNGIGRGLLIDWDFCVKLDLDGDGSRTARRLDRTGTWQFMSARLLEEIGVPHELEDDRESCLHVLTWMALRYTKHTIVEHKELSDFLKSFDEAEEGKMGIEGGKLKTLFLLRRDISNDVKFDNRPRLDELIKDLTLTFAVRYELEPSHAWEYSRRMGELKSRDWPVTTFRKFLELSPWPKADKPEVQVKLGKRKNTEELPTSSKSSRLHDGSGRHTGS